MLEVTLVTLASLLATSIDASIVPDPLSAIPSPSTNNESAPNITAIMSVPQVAFESYAQGGLVRSDTNIISGGDNIPPTTAVNQRWTCSMSPSFT